VSFGSVVSTTAIRGGGAASVVAITMLVARTLGVEAAATFFFGQSLCSFLSIVSRLGLDRASTKLGASILHTDEAERLPARLVRRVLAVTIVTAVIAAVIAAAGTWLQWQHLGRHRWTDLIWFLVATPFVSAYNVFGSTLLGLRKPATGTIVISALPAGLTLILMAGSKLHGGPNIAVEYYAAYLAGTIVAAIAGAILVKRALRHEPRGGSDGPIQRWRASLPSFAKVGIFSAVEQWYPTFVLGLLAAPAQVEGYAVCNRFVAAVQLVVVAVNSVYSPHYAHAADPKALRSVTRKASTQLLAAGISIILLVVVVRTPLLGLFGARYTGFSNVLVLLMVGQLFNILAGPSATALIMRDGVQIVARIFLLTSVVLLIGGAAAADLDSALLMGAAAMVGTALQTGWTMLAFRARYGFLALAGPSG
jgi:O-antigen/teichoic acid export membrane protein